MRERAFMESHRKWVPSRLPGSAWQAWTHCSTPRERRDVFSCCEEWENVSPSNEESSLSRVALSSSLA